MILHIRACDVEATFDSEGEFLTPDAAQDYLLRAARVARAVWAALPDAPTEAESSTED
jgi:hypothetical protein